MDKVRFKMGFIISITIRQNKVELSKINSFNQRWGLSKGDDYLKMVITNILTKDNN